MPHPLVEQLRFARSEFVRCLEGVSDADARRRVLPMNCLSWIVGHIANHEQSSWLFLAQGLAPFPELYELTGYGKPATTPPLDDMWTAWRAITAAADEYLDAQTAETLQTHLVYKGAPRPESVGTMIYRTIYHYWFHTGEAHAIRQQLGHVGLPDFVGPGLGETPYRPDGG